MTYVDLEGHRWYRLCDQDIIRMDKSGKFAQIFWEDGRISSLTPRRTAEILRDVWSMRRKSIRIWDLKHQDIEVTIDTGKDDYTNTGINNYRSTICLSYKGYSGMVIPKDGLLNYQGFPNSWIFWGRIREWTKGIFKRGVIRDKARGKAEKWVNQIHCPECEKELKMFNEAWGLSDASLDNPGPPRLVFHDRKKQEEAWDALAFWKARSFGLTQVGELPFNHYRPNTDPEGTHTHHLFKHIEAGEYPPELLAAALRAHNNPNMVEYSNDPLFGRKFKITTSNTSYLRWILRGYLQKRLGLPVSKI